MNTGDRRKRKTKEALKKGLMMLNAEKPIHQITVKEVVEAADINRSTFYHYYMDIPDMVKHLEDDLYQQFHQSINDFMTKERKGTTQEQEIGFAEEICKIIKENGEFCKCIFNSNGDISFVQKAEELIDYYNSYIDIRRHINLSPNMADHLIAFFRSGCMGCFRSWVNHGFLETPQEIAILIIEFRRMLFANSR